MGLCPPILEPRNQEYWTKKRELIKACPVQIGTYCSCDFPMRYVSVKEGTYKVRRGFTCEIPNGLTAKPEWDKQIEDFCKLMDIPYSKPKWLLVSLWC